MSPDTGLLHGRRARRAWRFLSMQPAGTLAAGVCPCTHPSQRAGPSWPASPCSFHRGSRCRRGAPKASPQVVVTANRVPQAADTVVADLVVIDAEQIARAGPIGLAELLQRHAGAELSVTGGPGQPSGVFLRGTNTSHVVVLVDGVRINSATTGTTALEHVPLAQIDRIEVLRGPASSLYGSDAIGGVIQIFTRTPDGISAGVSAGSDHRGEVRAGIGRTAGDWSWSLNAGALDVRSFSATNAAADPVFLFNPDDDPYRNKNANGAVQWRWADGHRVSVRGTVSSASTHFDSGPGSDDVNRQRLSTLSIQSEDRLADNWRSTLRLARGSDHSSSTGASTSTFDTDQDQVTWQNDVKLFSVDWSGGIEWRRERIASDTAFTQTSRTIGALFLAGQRSFDALQLEGSLRTDHNSQFGNHTTGRLGAGWMITPEWRIGGAAGTAFHAPSFNDLYISFAPFFAGNPDLKPESSRGLDAALRFHSGGTTLSLTAFDNRHRRLDRRGSDLQHGDQRQPRTHPWHDAGRCSIVGCMASRFRVDASEPARRRHRQPAGAARARSWPRRLGLRHRRVARRRRLGGQQRALRQRGQHAGLAHGRLRFAVAVCQLVDHARVHGRRPRAQRHRQTLRDRAGLQHRAAPVHAHARRSLEVT